jgi:hypothetical protein
MNEWVLAAIMCAVPFFAFGALEMFAALRRRQSEAVARRSKSRHGGT